VDEIKSEQYCSVCPCRFWVIFPRVSPTALPESMGKAVSAPAFSGSACTSVISSVAELDRLRRPTGITLLTLAPSLSSGRCLILLSLAPQLTISQIARLRQSSELVSPQLAAMYRPIRHRHEVDPKGASTPTAGFLTLLRQACGTHMLDNGCPLDAIA
jgi:hypothetical protein